MFDVADLFQWERFITPAIIKPFYWLIVCLSLMLGIYGISAAFGTMTVSFLPGFIMLIVSLFGIIIGVLFARIAAEFVLIAFRINEHLGAIRSRGGM